MIVGECGLCWSVISGFDAIADYQWLNGLEEEVEGAIVGSVADHGPNIALLDSPTPQ